MTRLLIAAILALIAAPAFAFWHGIAAGPPPAFTPTYYIYGF